MLFRSIKVAKSEQACAFGASMFAAVVAGVYDKVEEAQKEMGQGFACEYQPDKQRHEAYSKIYKDYKKLGLFTETELFNK